MIHDNHLRPGEVVPDHLWHGAIHSAILKRGCRTRVSVVLVAIVSYVLALYVRFGAGRLPRIVRSLYLIPMFVPVVIAAYAAIIFYVDRGVLAALLHVVGIPYVSPAYKPGGVVLTQVWFNIPFAVLMLGSGLDGIVHELIESANVVGAGFLTVL